jgi:hypothetical protein
MNKIPLKIGLIIDGDNLSKYDLALVQWMKQQPSLCVSHIISQQLPLQPQLKRWQRALSILLRQGLARFLQTTLWNIASRIEIYRLKRQEAFANHLQFFSATAHVQNQIKVAPIISPSGFVHRFSSEDIERVEKEKFDVLIRMGSGILKGDILSAAKFGILSFHHADNQINRGGPAGFWEVYHRLPKTGFVIQKLTEELDGGDVLVRGFYPTQAYAMLNNAYIQQKSLSSMKRLLIHVAAHRNLPAAEEKMPYDGKLLIYPTALECFKYIVNQTLRLLIARVRRIRGIEDCWHVSYQHRNWHDVSLWRGTTIPNPKGHFLADPFVMTHNDKHYVFVEDYEYKTNKGLIAVYDITTTIPKYVGVALEEHFHLSFPYLFEYNGALYMCPESLENQDIRIYKCLEFPLKWELVSIAMSGIIAADTLIFYHDSKWWLFANISDSVPIDFSELHIFWSDNPLSGQWQPHKRNPVIIDSEMARNGGLVKKENMFLRIAQQQGESGQYGTASVLRRINNLSTENYEESTVKILHPSFAKKVFGTHHFHTAIGVSVWDYKTYISENTI